MQTRKKHIASATSKYLAILIVFLIAVNTTLSILLSSQSGAAMRAQI